MPRTPTRLALAALTTTPAVLYTTPGSTKTEIKHVHVLNESVSTVTFDLSIGSGEDELYIFKNREVAGGQAFEHHCFYVLNATDPLNGVASDTGLTITVNGAEVT